MWNEDDEFGSGASTYWQEPDFVLADLVSGFVNKGGLQLGITLFMKGTVVTGTLISERDYLKAMTKMFTEQIKKSMNAPTSQDIQAAEAVFDFTPLAEDVELSQVMKAGDDPDDFDFPTIRHLHLQDPVVLLPNPSISFSHSKVSIMRIRLISIDSWMIGKVNVEDLIDEDDFPPFTDIRH